MSALVEHLTKAEQAVEFALRDLRAVQAMPEVSTPNVMLMGALIQQADSLHKLIGMVREAAAECVREQLGEAINRVRDLIRHNQI